MEKQKMAIIDFLYSHIAANTKAKEQFKKEFSVDDKTFEKMVKKLLLAWLESPDIARLMAEIMMHYSGDYVDDDEAGYFG